MAVEPTAHDLSVQLSRQAADLARRLGALEASADVEAPVETGWDSEVLEAVAGVAETLRLLGGSLGVDVDGPGASAGGALAVPTDGPSPAVPVEVTVPVLGVDACEGGWVGAILEPGAPRPRIAVAATIGGLVETVRQSLDLQAVAIGVPGGLSQDPTRQAEVDAWVRSRPTVLVLGADPERSFAVMAGAPIGSDQMTDDGRAARLAALAAAGLASPSVLAGSGYAAHDVLDACAAAWTAARRTTGVAGPLPDPPQRFSQGLPAIWV